jgi:Ala-tRNA(Pro) deacylase
MNDRLRDILVREKARFELIRHREVFTAQERAAASQIPGRRLAKVVVVRDDEGSGHHPWFALAVIPASARLDIPQLRTVTGRRHLALAREDEFARLFPDCAAGAMPPFGTLYGLPALLDRSLADEPELVFEAGSHQEEIRMPTAEYLRMEQPTIASIAAQRLRAA